MPHPLFVSHGAPTLPFEDVAARDFIRGMAGIFERPSAIVVISAHWETREPRVTASAHPQTIHDFYGFPAEAYELSYPAPGDPALADRIIDLLGTHGLAAGLDFNRGLDHGAWGPLILAWPDAGVPVVQLSVQSQLGPAHHLDVGRALAPLADEGVLILASGGLTHDLSSWRGSQKMVEPDWVRSFADWVITALDEARIGDLLCYRAHAPYAARNHPTEEHFLPLFVALGAAGLNARALHVHSSVTYGVLRMDAFAFERTSVN